MFTLVNPNHTANPMANAANAIKASLKTTNYVTPETTRAVLSFESNHRHDDNVRMTLESTGQSMANLVTQMCQSLNIDPTSVTQGQQRMAIYGGMMAGSPDIVGAFEGLNFNQVSEVGRAIIVPNNADSFQKRTLSTEAFNDVDNRTSLAYSVMYNFLVARQNEVTETWWAPIILSPDQIGLEVHVNLLNVFNGAKHKFTGQWEDWARTNLVRAVANPNILAKNETTVIPVFRPGTEDSFVDTALVTPFVEMADETAITTNFLRVEQKIDLIGIAATDAILATGTPDQRDDLDPSITLRSILVKVGNDLIKFETSGLRYSNFVYGNQNDVNRQMLNFSTSDLLLRPESLNLDGSALQDLAVIKTNNLMVYLEMDLSGHCNRETSETKVGTATVRVHQVVSTIDGHILANNDPLVLAIADTLKTKDARVIGYRVTAYRSNAQRRQRGQLINIQRFTQLFQVPWRSPIAVERPAHKGAEEDASDLQGLMAAIRTRIDNESITAIITTNDDLKEYTDARGRGTRPPQMTSMGGWYVWPTHIYRKIELDKIVASLSSSDRADDIASAIVVQLRDVASRLYTYSEYKAASDVLFGGTAKPPKVILLTDPITARYLIVDGELRTLGNDFNYKITQTLDNRISGKIYMAFTTEDAGGSNEVNILNFGNLVMSPELVLAANMTRTGGYNKETQVQPRYLFVNHCPIMAEIDITGIAEAIGQMPINTRVIP